jgi:hypothetical protein
MRKKLKYWIIHFFLTVVASFLFNAGVFAGYPGDVSLSKGGMGAIKLSGKNLIIPFKDKSSIVPHRFRKHLGQGHRTRAQQKGER